MMKPLKCVVVGDSYVGKTSLLESYVSGAGLCDWEPTIFGNYASSVGISGQHHFNEEKLRDVLAGATPSYTSYQRFELDIWDTSGSDDLNALRPLTYPQTDVFVVCFSLVDARSWIHVYDKWLPEVRQHIKIKPRPAPILLVGTKADSVGQGMPSVANYDAIDELVSQGTVSCYTECSAMDFAHVTKVFELAVKLILLEGPCAVSNCKDDEHCPEVSHQSTPAWNSSWDHNYTARPIIPYNLSTESYGATNSQATLDLPDTSESHLGSQYPSVCGLSNDFSSTIESQSQSQSQSLLCTTVKQEKRSKLGRIGSGKIHVALAAGSNPSRQCAIM